MKYVLKKQQKQKQKNNFQHNDDPDSFGLLPLMKLMVFFRLHLMDCEWKY